MLFKEEVDAYVKRKSILEDNTQKEYYTVSVKCTKLLKIKLKNRKGRRKASTKCDVLEMIKIINPKNSGLKTRSIHLFRSTKQRKIYKIYIKEKYPINTIWENK